VETVKGPAEGRVLLRNVSWETYKRLIAEREERPVPRFFYDRGELEIASPSKRHETISRVIALLVEIVAEERIWTSRARAQRRSGAKEGREVSSLTSVSTSLTT
jgi:Uma2 family endonuclease